MNRLKIGENPPPFRALRGTSIETIYPFRYLCFALNPFGEVYSRLYHIRMVEAQLPIAVAGPFLFSDIPMMNARRRRP